MCLRTLCHLSFIRWSISDKETAGCLCRFKPLHFSAELVQCSLYTCKLCFSPWVLSGSTCSSLQEPFKEFSIDLALHIFLPTIPRNPGYHWQFAQRFHCVKVVAANISLSSSLKQRWAPVNPLSSNSTPPDYFSFSILQSSPTNNADTSIITFIKLHMAPFGDRKAFMPLFHICTCTPQHTLWCVNWRRCPQNKSINHIYGPNVVTSIASWSTLQYRKRTDFEIKWKSHICTIGYHL